MPLPRLLGLLAGAVTLLLVAPAWAEGAEYVPSTLIVTFEEGAGAGERAAAHRAAGARVADRIPQIDAEVVRVAAGRGGTALRRYRDEVAVAVAERDVVMRALTDDCGSTSSSCFVPSDSDYRREWGLQSDAFTIQPDTTFDHDADIDAPYAWQVTKGSSATRIAVLDSGTDRNHEDVAPKVIRRAKFVTGPPDDKLGHGTHVAGTAAAITDNALGVAGVSFNASLLSVKVINNAGVGTCSSTANGITWATDNGAHVINMSLGGLPCSALENAVNYAWDNGVLLAAAAGNDGQQAVVCPACYANTIAVAATDNSDVRAGFSNFGPGVDIAAPGVRVFSAFPNHANASGQLNYGYNSGTSMATPHVAGAAGLIWSLVSDTNANGRVNDEVRSRIETYADNIAGTGTLWSAGRLNVCRAATANASCPLH